MCIINGGDACKSRKRKWPPFQLKYRYHLISWRGMNNACMHACSTVLPSWGGTLPGDAMFIYHFSSMRVCINNLPHTCYYYY